MNTLIPLTEKDLTLKVECWLIESAVAWLQLATSRRLVEFIALQMLEQQHRPRKLPTQHHINCNAHAEATTSTNTVPPEATTFLPSEGSTGGSNCSVSSMYYLSCCSSTHILSSLRSPMGVCSKGITHHNKATTIPTPCTFITSLEFTPWLLPHRSLPFFCRFLSTWAFHPIALLSRHAPRVIPQSFGVFFGYLFPVDFWVIGIP